ncbi:MAG: NADP-dependent malic enzyme [Pseudomonadota bacterium]
MDENFRKAALDYHRYPRPGKIALMPTKQMVSQRDLALAYSPGVAAACDEIVRDPQESYNMTARGNLVAVITNGTAVLGLGNIGPLASKPVMEGKGVLFKKFAGIDVFDIEINESDPDKLIDIIASLEPTFGGINLEDIKAPECFYIERELRKRMKIPVFHDDQHGTAIVAAAAVLNGLRVVGKDIKEVKLVCSGAGAAALACLDQLVSLGLSMKNIWVSDSKGVVYHGRAIDMDDNKARYAQTTDARTLGDIIEGADIFMGLSAAGVLKKEMVVKMAARPLILAMANPTPEILPEDVHSVRDDAIVATGRSDYPNQVNNVLCFPFIFRGALDVGASTINEEMKLACVRAIAALAMEEQSDVVANAYGNEKLSFGPHYLIPRPFDPRLILRVAPAIAQAAMDSGVATRPITDMDAYRAQLSQHVYTSSLTMRPVFSAAKKEPQRIVFAEGEEERVLRAARLAVEDGVAKPILVGNPQLILNQIESMGLRMKQGVDYEVLNPESYEQHRDYADEYYKLMCRKGMTAPVVERDLRRKRTLIAAMMVRQGDADALICGTDSLFHHHFPYIQNAIGLRQGVKNLAAMNILILPNRTIAITDTYVHQNPTAEELADIAIMAAEELPHFGIKPKAALLSNSSFGSSQDASAVKMREALEIIRKRAPHIEIDGEMQGDAALSADIRQRVIGESTLTGEANLLIMPNLDTANITYNLLRIASGENVTIGPVLLGTAKPAYILTPISTVRRILNMTALASVAASTLKANKG